MVQLLFIVVFVGTAALVAWHVYQAEQRRRRQAQAHAASLGYHLDLETKDPPRLDFELFDSGHSKKVTYHTWRDGSPDNVFQYQYTRRFRQLRSGGVTGSPRRRSSTPDPARQSGRTPPPGSRAGRARAR